MTSNTFRPAQGVAVSVDDDGIVLFHAREGRLFSTRRIGVRIWRGIEREMPSETIAAEVSREHNIPRNTAEEYTRTFIVELQRHRLIEQVARP